MSKVPYSINQREKFIIELYEKERAKLSEIECVRHKPSLYTLTGVLQRNKPLRLITSKKIKKGSPIKEYTITWAGEVYALTIKSLRELEDRDGKRESVIRN